MDRKDAYKEMFRLTKQKQLLRRGRKLLRIRVSTGKHLGLGNPKALKRELAMTETLKHLASEI